MDNQTIGFEWVFEDSIECLSAESVPFIGPFLLESFSHSSGSSFHS